MNSNLQEKYNLLLSNIKDLGKIAIAFSGGVDSTFLLYAANEAIGDNVIAYTIKTPYIPDWEVDEAIELCKSIGARHEILELPIPDNVKNNPEDRCYLCKTILFKTLLAESAKNGAKYLAEGSNTDDGKDYRPGRKALKELSVRSPLEESGLSKIDIRSLSKEFGLHTWDKPSYACLLTRLPYDTPVYEDDFEKIEKAELFMFSKGFKGCRVRTHGNIARIEVQKNHRIKIADEKLMDDIVENFKKLGFRFVSLDLEGYRMGSFNETIDT